MKRDEYVYVVAGKVFEKLVVWLPSLDYSYMDLQCTCNCPNIRYTSQ